MESVVDLRRFSLTELQRLLSLSEAAAALVARRCHGRDDEVVREVAPQSVTATSWLARDWLVSVACTSALPCCAGAGAVCGLSGLSAPLVASDVTR